MPHRYLVWAIAGLLTYSVAYAQSEPEYYSKPEKVAEYWRAVKFEVSIGKYEMAASLIKGLLEKNPTDEELLAIEAKDGMAPLLRLRNIPVWTKLSFPAIEDKFRRKQAEEKATALNEEYKKNAETLIQKVSAAVKAKLGDTKQIAKFAANLRATPEEAAFAEKELYRSGSAAIPVLISLMKTDEDLRLPIRQTLSRLDLSTVPVVLACLEIPDPSLQLELLEALRNRGDYFSLPAQVETDPLPILNFLSSKLASIPEPVRSKAGSMLEGLSVKDPKDALVPELNTPQGQLWKAANKLYEHKGRFRDTNQVTLWTAEAADKITSRTGSVSDGEEFFGLKYLRWSLKIQPDFLRSQQLFLKLAIEKHFQRTGLDKPLNLTSPELHELLVGAPYDLLSDLLVSSIQEQKSGVALGVIQALSDRIDPRAVATSKRANEKIERPALLEEALNHPDFRVQLAAAVAILKISTKKPLAPDAVVKILSQAVRNGVESAQKGKPTALIGDFDQLRGQSLANLVRKAGFDVEWIRTGKDLLRRIVSDSNVDLVILDTSIPGPPVSDVIAQMRSDNRMKSIPVLFSQGFENKTTKKESLIKLAGYYRNVVLVNEMLTDDAVKEGLSKVLISADTQVLSLEEKKRNAAVAIEWLKRIALGERVGYPIAPAANAIREALSDSELVNQAIEASSNIPNKELQQDLANLFLNAGQPVELRVKAADAVIKQFQQFGAGLAPNQLKIMNDLLKTETNPVIKGKLTALLGVIQANSKLTGEALQGYSPKFSSTPPTAPSSDAPAPKEKN